MALRILTTQQETSLISWLLWPSALATDELSPKECWGCSWTPSASVKILQGHSVCYPPVRPQAPWEHNQLNQSLTRRKISVCVQWMNEWAEVRRLACSRRDWLPFNPGRFTAIWTAAHFPSSMNTFELPLAPVSRYYLVLGSFFFFQVLSSTLWSCSNWQKEFPLISSRNKVIRMLQSYLH